MGVQVALARIGSQAGYAVAIPLARAFGITTPVLVGLICCWAVWLLSLSFQ